MEVSENSQVENSLKESPDGSGDVKVDVEEPEPEPEPEQEQEPRVRGKDGPEEWAVEVIQAAKEDEENVENSKSSDVTAEEKGKEVENSSPFPGVVSELPVSDANNVEPSSGVIGSGNKEPDADPYVPTTSGGAETGVPEVSEIPRSTEAYQTYTTLSHQTRASWLNCCGLLDVFKGSNQ